MYNIGHYCILLGHSLAQKNLQRIIWIYILLLFCINFQLCNFTQVFTIQHIQEYNTGILTKA